MAGENAGVQIGDFFVSLWGYDQTQATWFKVIGMTPSGKSVKVQQWRGKVVEDNGPSVYVVPGDGPVTSIDYSAAPAGADYWDRKAAGVEVEAGIETKRLNSYGEGENQRFHFTVNSFSSAGKWDGSPAQVTGHGWGH